MIVYSNYRLDTRPRREAETLAAAGHKVSVIGLLDNGHSQISRLKGVSIYQVNMKKYTGRNKLLHLLSYVKFLLLAKLLCIKLLFKFKIDVVHVHNMPDFLVFAAMLPRILGKKLILDIHDSMPETFTGKYHKPSTLLFKALCVEERLSCALVHEIISVHHVQRNILVKRGIPSNKIEIIMNVPDHKVYTCGHRKGKYDIEKQKLKLVYHGTVEKVLGIDIAIEAVARLVPAIPELKFYIFHRGQDLSEYLFLCKELGVEQQVDFAQKVFSPSVMPRLLKAMDIGIICNRQNTLTELMLPTKLLEYAALGIPVVAPRLKTIRYYFSEDMISFFEPENVDSIVEAILKLYRDESGRERQAHKAFDFLNKYGWDKHHKRLLKLYQSIY